MNEVPLSLTMRVGATKLGKYVEFPHHPATWDTGISNQAKGLLTTTVVHDRDAEPVGCFERIRQ